MAFTDATERRPDLTTAKIAARLRRDVNGVRAEPRRLITSGGAQQGMGAAQRSTTPAAAARAQASMRDNEDLNP